MLTTCRTLMGDPELIMSDEPTDGLAPLIVQQIGDCTHRGSGVSTLFAGVNVGHRALDLHRAHFIG